METLLFLRFTPFHINNNKNPQQRKATVSRAISRCPPSPIWKSLFGSEAFWEELSMGLLVWTLIQSAAYDSGTPHPQVWSAGPTAYSWGQANEKNTNNWWETLYEGLFIRKNIQGLSPGLPSSRKPSWTIDHSGLCQKNFSSLYDTPLNAHGAVESQSWRESGDI